MRSRFTFALVALSWLATGFAAQDYPDKPVLVLVPTPTGSPPDMVARLISPGLTALFSQQFIVDNRSSGGDGMLGTELAAKSTPDGYTLLVGTPGTLTITRYVHKDVPYDTLRDFAPIKWFFCLNFSNQLVLFALRWLSELPTVCAKKRALSRIIASVS